MWRLRIIKFFAFLQPFAFRSFCHHPYHSKAEVQLKHQYINGTIHSTGYSTILAAYSYIQYFVSLHFYYMYENCTVFSQRQHVLPVLFSLMLVLHDVKYEVLLSAYLTAAHYHLYLQLLIAVRVCHAPIMTHTFISSVFFFKSVQFRNYVYFI